MKRLCLIVTCTVLVVGMWAPTASAIPSFYKQFKAKYVDGDVNKDFAAENKEFVAAVNTKKTRCFVCHDPKKDEKTGKASKKNRNVYGQALSKLLDKKKDKKDLEKIQKAIDTVAAMKSNPENPNSPTFGELIEAGKLPGGAAN